MNFRLCTGLAAIVCMSLASCYPYNENSQKKKPTKAAEKTTATPDQLKAKEKEQEELKKQKEQEELKKKEELTPGGTAENTGTGTPPTEEPKTESKRTDYAFANKVPGKEGFVFSPYNNKVVDVRDIPSGTLVQDPTYPAAEKKYFRVP